MDKSTVAEVLHDIGVLLELKGENRFKSLAYTQAARALENTSLDLSVLVKENRLDEIKGVGKGLSEKITELVTTGHLPYYEELKQSLPQELLDCLRVPGLGPKKVKILWEKLEIDSLGDLKLSCERGMVAGLEGFGEKTQAKILEGIRDLEKYRGQYLYLEAQAAAQPVLEALRGCKAIQQVQIGGSLRRKKEVVRDLDFLTSTSKAEEVMKFFTSLSQVEKVISKGPTKSSVILKSGLQADLRCVSREEYPFALVYFTGSKEHNIILRQRSIEQGKKLNEYGLFEVREKKGGASEKLIPCESEEEVYRQLGLAYIEPELREDMGEWAAAEKKELPDLVSDPDIRGAFHSHTRWSDGRDTLEEMAEAAMKRGWQYLGISDHSKNSRIAHGLDEKRLASQGVEIKRLNRKFSDQGKKFRLFAGSEVDILKDGRLDFSDDVLADLDFVVASVHQGFSLEESAQTGRVIKALSHPRVTMLGHSTGRLLLSRQPYRIDLNAVIAAAAKHKKIIELNCTPSRMDMDWRWWKNARDQGVMCSINPDAHAADQLDYVSLGVGAARKGWLRAGDVLNTRELGEVERFLGERKNGS